jgi:hypothetical protein
MLRSVVHAAAFVADAARFNFAPGAVNDKSEKFSTS